MIEKGVIKIAENFLIAGLAISISLNIIIVPLGLWLGWRGVWLKYWRWKMRLGKFDGSFFVDKSNNIRLIFTDRDGSRIRIKKGSYVATPEPTKLYRLWGIPLRIRRENDPEDIDIWDRDNESGLTAKELDNVVNEAQGSGLAEILKQYFPVLIIVAGLFLLIAVAGLYFGYINTEVLKEIAPEIVKRVGSFK